MAIPLLGVLGWAFVPHHATKQLLNVLHYISVHYLRSKAPLVGTLEYQRNYRYAFAAVVFSYLIYTLIQSSNNMLPNYYEILGAVPTADENALKLAFRQFAKRYHPDRVGPQGEALFITVRDAFEALKNPTVRFAYDRFGPDVLGWQQCSTPGEYLRTGLTHSAGYHIVAGAFLVLWTAIGETSPVAFWRYVLYVSLFACELALILAPSPSTTATSLLIGPWSSTTAEPTHRTILHAMFPRRVAYQHILFLHQIFLFLSIALSRVAPQFFPDASKVTAAMTQRLLQLVGAADREVSQLLHTELHVLQPSAEHVPIGRLRPVTQPAEDVMDVLSTEMEKMIIEGAVRQDGGPFKSVWEAAIEKGRRMLAASLLARPRTPTKTLTPSKSFIWGSPLMKGSASANGHVHGGRMSPPPPPSPSLDRPGYVRARSISLT
ncbi:DnaJ-domain-containing protein [Roridomyces roridus]|uniref:DnaJ-domain-containing protein n=1 Tax=Roridomyces roridus TaxID=1738132 RepID=A0AAD7B5Y9_9AGAR|nr:DnaJ-domain-containing protein [Roridomyces roridus]